MFELQCRCDDAQYCSLPHHYYHLPRSSSASFADDTFSSSYIPTIGVDFKIRTLFIPADKYPSEVFLASSGGVRLQKQDGRDGVVVKVLLLLLLLLSMACTHLFSRFNCGTLLALNVSERYAFHILLQQKNVTYCSDHVIILPWCSWRVHSLCLRCCTHVRCWFKGGNSAICG